MMMMMMMMMMIMIMITITIVAASCPHYSCYCYCFCFCLLLLELLCGFLLYCLSTGLLRNTKHTQKSEKSKGGGTVPAGLRLMVLVNTSDPNSNPVEKYEHSLCVKSNTGNDRQRHCNVQLIKGNTNVLSSRLTLSN